MINKIILFLNSIIKRKKPNRENSKILENPIKIEKVVSELGIIFEGEFIDGVLHGQGKITFPDGELQEGIFENGKIVQGKIDFPDGEKQKGFFVNGRLQGNSEVVFSDGERQVGNFVLGLLHGKGRIEFLSGIIHEGLFVHGSLHGEGSITQADGSIFKTQFHEGIPSGEGKIILSDGMEVLGSFKYGKFSAFQDTTQQLTSQQLAETASEIDSDFSSDQVLITFPTHPSLQTENISHKDSESLPLGLLLSGSLDNGILNGMAKVIFPSGKLIHGNFNSGFMEGYAVVILPDGTVRQGEFRDNLLHGLGEVTLPTGSVIRGIFNRGKLVTETH